MEKICLLTDGSAQYESTDFRGFDRIHSILPDIQLNGKIYPSGKGLKAENFPASAFQNHAPSLVIPDLSKVCERIDELAENYDYIIAILSSRSLNPLYNVIEKAVQTNCGKIKGQIINSQAIAAGLGFMIEMAAGAVMDGLRPPEIEHRVRRRIPHIYTTLCMPGWSYLHQSNLVDHAQAETGEMLNLYPVFTLEDGGLAPIQKVRADHSIFEYFQEFLDEFEELDQITFLYHDQVPRQEADFLRDHIREMFSRAQYREICLNTNNSVILGPRALGLTVIEKTSA